MWSCKSRWQRSVHPVWEMLAAAGGIMHGAELLQHVSSQALARAVRNGWLLRPYPRIYVLPELADDPIIRARAALRYLGPEAVLSHLSAVRLCGLPVAGSPVHATIGPRRPFRQPDGLVVHRRHVRPHQVRTRNGLPVLALEPSLVDSWAWLTRHPDHGEFGRLRRELVIAAVRQRLTTADRLWHAVDAQQEAAGRAEMIRLGRRAVYLDVLERRTLTNFELDGRPWHASVGDRERDTRRDAALAAKGFLVVRFSGARLCAEPGAVRAEIRTIIAARGAHLPS